MAPAKEGSPSNLGVDYVITFRFADKSEQIP